jgi:DNA modification methylase
MKANYNIITGPAKQVLESLAYDSIHCCVTSPPYFNQRDYGIEGQIGLEGTLNGYLSSLVEVFNGVHNVLRDDGTLWVNLGDTFYNYRPNSKKKQTLNKTDCDMSDGRDKKLTGLKEKDLVGVPWQFALAMRDAGWWLRQEIIWHKPNPMPASVNDRCTVAHEQIFMFTKRKNYYYDKYATMEMVDYGDLGTGIKNSLSVWTIPTSNYRGAHFATYPVEIPNRCIRLGCPIGYCTDCGNNIVRVVEKERVPTRPGKDTKNIGDTSVIGNKDPNRNVSIIKGMRHQPTCNCDHRHHALPTVLDPFSGAGTTGIAALNNGCNYIGIELNPEYAQISRNRLDEHRRST